MKDALPSHVNKDVESVAPHHSARSPTPQGTFDLSPQGTLSRLANLANCQPNHMATLTVAQRYHTYYNPILDYLALSQPLQSGSGPKWHPLALSGFHHGGHGRHMSHRRGSHERNSLHIMQTERPSVLVFYGLGEASFLWPPPPHLTAKSLVAEREKKMEALNQSILESQSGAVSVIHRDIKQNMSHLPTVMNTTPFPGEHSHPDFKEIFPSQPPLDEKKETIKPSTLYMAHYTIDVGDDDSEKNEILLASPEGPEKLRSFLDEIREWRSDQRILPEYDEREFSLLRFRKGHQNEGYWEDEGLRETRPIESVVLADNNMEEIVGDVEEFLHSGSKTWYFEHGIPFRRSYMFYGPPGTGKTSTICAIASKFRLNCCFLSMTNSDFSNQDLCDAMSRIPGNAMLVLEDVDTLFNENRKHEEGSSLTFSGMLNALDGVVSADGVITVMTTNHFDRLDQSLVRGGRVDRRFHFGRPTQKMIQVLFTRYYPDEEEIAEEFGKEVFGREEGDELRSIATLQQLFIQYRGKSAKECLEGLPAFCKSHFPESSPMV